MAGMSGWSLATARLVIWPELRPVGTTCSVIGPKLLYCRYSLSSHALAVGCCTVGIAHPDAGDGLFLQGAAPVGAVVALYPGLVYEPMHYR